MNNHNACNAAMNAARELKIEGLGSGEALLQLSYAV